MISFDTNIAVHAANEDSNLHLVAREFLEQLGQQRDVVVCELMLVELFLKLCNQRIFRRPMTPAEAGDYCQCLRNNSNWMLVESASVMADVWPWSRQRGFAFRRIIDVRLGLTLRSAGVTRLATTNVKDFKGLGFVEVWNPLLGEV